MTFSGPSTRATQSLQALIAGAVYPGGSARSWCGVLFGVATFRAAVPQVNVRLAALRTTQVEVVSS